MAATAEKTKVLLVDDEPKNLAALGAILDGMDLDIVTAASGEEALRCLLREDYALILLDVKLPGIDGLETAALIRGRERSRSTPIIFLTAYDGTDSVMRAYSLGAADFMMKPFVGEILRYKVAVFVELHRKTAEVQQRAEEQKAEKIRRDFFASVSHELRTPLTLIKLPVHVLRAGRLGPLNPEQLRQVELIERNGDKLLALVNDLLDFSRIEAGNETLLRRPTDLRDLLRAIAAPFEKAYADAELALSLRLPGEPLVLEVDRPKIDKVVGNLLMNALKFTAEGSVTVSLARTPAGVEIAVTDTGPGMTAEAVSRLFTRFVKGPTTASRSYAGTGLGLALARRLTELHGGTIECESAPGQGSTFRVVLPDQPCGAPEPIDPGDLDSLLAGRLAIQERSPSRGARPAAPAPSAPRVLLVEDEADIAEHVEQLLGDICAVSRVADGVEAVERLRRSPVDVVVSDVMMPGMSGVELCRTIKADPELRVIPVVLMSALARKENVVAGLESGADDYVTKPFDAEIFRSKVLVMARVKRLQAELLERERLSAIGHVAVTLQHQINDDLQALAGAVQLLRTTASPGGGKGLLDTIDRVGRHIATVLRQVQQLDSVQTLSYASEARMIDVGARAM